MSRSLEELLREADESAPPPPAQSGLADRIRERSRTAARRRRAGGIAAVSLSVGIAAAVVFRLLPPREATRIAKVTPVTKPSPMIVTPAAAATLKADAALTMSVVNELRAREQRRARATKARQQSVRDSGPASISAELDRAALTMLDHGDRLRRDLKQVDAALAAYRRTIELFPDTRWAAIAKQRIEQLKPDARRVGTQHSLT